MSPRIITPELSRKIGNMGFLCACLVVFMHVGVMPAADSWQWWCVSFLGGGGIARIAVPFFFLVSGFLFASHLGNSGWYVRQVRSRAHSLLVPYVFWNFAYWGLLAALTFIASHAGLHFGGLENNGATVLGVRDVLGLVPWQFSELGLLWFVRCLIVLVLVSPIFLVLRRFPVAVVSVVFLHAVFFFLPLVLPTNPSRWEMPWLANGWCKSLVYFSTGIALRFHAHRLPRMPLLLGKGSLCMGMILFGLEILLRACGHPLADDLVDRFSVPFLMYGVWSVVPSTAWRSRLLSCTFPIYLLHAFVAVAFMAGLKVSGLNRIASPSLALFLVKGMAMLGGAMILSMCFRRLFPKISAIAFGGR